MREGGKLAGGNPARGRVENDFYATHPDSVKALLKVETIIYPAWECACGEGHISKEVVGTILSTDLIYRNFGIGGVDFLSDETLKNMITNLTDITAINTIITNPPFNLFQEFLEKSLQMANKKVIFFGKLQALEGIKRATYLETTPLRTVYVFKKRQQLMRNGKELDDNGKKMSSTMAFAWYVWEIEYTGKPTIVWI